MGIGGESGSRPSVGVVGLGLMGGSVCRALRARPNAPEILATDTDASQGDHALEAGVVDHFHVSAADIVRRADVVVYATPLGAARGLMREHVDLWKPNAVVTDVVSLKAPILASAVSGGFEGRFVGAHPICGGEASGFDAARADLFEGATVWLCAHDTATPGLRARGESFWSGLGGLPRWIEASEHDERMAWVSHLPQLVANALAGALDAAGYRPEDLGPGGRDMTRLAGSNPAVWRDLLEASAPVTGAGITSVAHALDVLADLLARREVDRIAEFMARTRAWRSESS